MDDLIQDFNDGSNPNGIWKLENEQLAAGFIEFEAWRGQCRFNNCLHASEPGCAIKQAVADGLIREWRYRSYLRLLEQNG